MSGVLLTGGTLMVKLMVKLMLEKRAAHLVRVAGDNGVQARLRAALTARSDDGPAVPCLLRGEVIVGKLGRQPVQLRW